MQNLKFKQLTKETWKDFETLFGERGACGGCWCMSWLLPKAQFEKGKGDGNKKAMMELVENGEQIGLITYSGKEPIGWCAVAPREKYLKLANSRVLKPVDDKPVWSIVCFFITKNYRRKGLSVEILKGVVEFCRKKGVQIIEGYPTEPYTENVPAAFAWTGFPNAFIKAGFKEVERRSKPRPIMRYFL